MSEHETGALAGEGQELKCPECGSRADRPRCLWELGTDCPRHDALATADGEGLTGARHGAGIIAEQLIAAHEVLDSLGVARGVGTGGEYAHPVAERIRLLAAARPVPAAPSEPLTEREAPTEPDGYVVNAMVLDSWQPVGIGSRRILTRDEAEREMRASHPRRVRPVFFGPEWERQSCGDCDPCIGGAPHQCAVGSYFAEPPVWIVTEDAAPSEPSAGETPAASAPLVGLTQEHAEAAHFAARILEDPASGGAAHPYRAVLCREVAHAIQAGPPPEWVAEYERLKGEMLLSRDRLNEHQNSDTPINLSPWIEKSEELAAAHEAAERALDAHVGVRRKEGQDG